MGWNPVLVYVTSWQVSDVSYVFKIVWYPDPPPHSEGCTGKVVGIPDSEVAADCWEALCDALMRHIDRHIAELREAAGAPYKEGKIHLKFEEISEEEFGPLFPEEDEDEDWDEEDEE